MGLRLPEQRSSAAPKTSKQYDNTDAILKVMGTNPYAQAIDQITPILSQALQRRAELRKQGQTNDLVSKSLGLEVPPGTDISQIPTETLIQTAQAKTSADKANQYDFVGLSGDQKNMIVLNKHTGQTELHPLPGGFSPKAPPQKQGGLSGLPGDKDFTTLEKRLDPAEASGRSVFGKAADISRRADNAIGLIQARGGNLTKSEANALAADMAGILSGGGSGVGEEMTKMHGYSTAYGDFKGMVQYIAGQPEGVLPTAISQRLLSNFQDFKGLSERNIKNTQGRLLYANQHLSRVDPERYKRLYEISGISPDEIQNGKYTPKTQLQPLPVASGGGVVTIKASDGSMHRLPSANLDKARHRDPGLQVVQ